MSKEDAEYLKKYPSREAFWISPEGDAYPCTFMQHEGLARKLFVAWCTELDLFDYTERDLSDMHLLGKIGGSLELDQRNWMKISNTGWIMVNDLTDPQIDVVMQIMDQEKDEQRKDQMKRDLKYLIELPEQVRTTTLTLPPSLRRTKSPNDE